MTKEELIDKLERELQVESGITSDCYRIGYDDGWIEATQRIIALLKEVK